MGPASGAVFGLLLNFSAAAGDDASESISAEIAITSDYVYRGLSFSDGHPAVQAAATWTPLAGLHIDGWASSIDFGQDDPTDAEVSATLGYGIETAVATLDSGITYIAYPGSPRGGHYDYVEVYGAAHAALAGGEVRGALHYTPRYSGDAGPALFSDVEGTWPLGAGLSGIAAVGHAHLDPRAGEDYVYWQAGLSAGASGIMFDLRYHGSNARACATPCVDRVALTILKAF